MKKVLILTAGFGDGHNTAARNIAEAIDLTSEEAKVEVLDLLESSLGTFNGIVKKAYLGIVQYAPSVWGGIYAWLDNSQFLDQHLGGYKRLRNGLEDILKETQPDCVVSTYPLYAHLIHEMYRDHRERAFRLITVITDSISINACWYRSPSDIYCVANDMTRDVLLAANVPAEKIHVLGFPVSPMFNQAIAPVNAPVAGEPRKLLYIINSGKKKAGRAIERLLELPKVQLTITVGRDAELKSELLERTKLYADRVRILGWTNQMPELLLGSHLVIAKAGGATVQEALAARCPMIINQVLPGQEQGNAELIKRYELGTVVTKNREVVEQVEAAFANDGALWKRWRRNIQPFSKPDAALRLAELVLAECEWSDPARKRLQLFASPVPTVMKPAAAAPLPESERMLLCDFHIHSNYSDGRLAVPEIIDFYGSRGFDCICITDHVSDPRRLIGKLTKLSNLTLAPDQYEEYFAVLERERQRAWRKYRMIVMAGVEFNKDGYLPKSSAHLLGIGLTGPIDPRLELEDLIGQIHLQGGLAVASHPHKAKSIWGKNTLYLWEHQARFTPIIDAWEIANRDDIFNPVGLKRLPFLANSDFHKPKHIYSWKTLLYCAKEADAIKECVRQNQHVAITLYRQQGVMAQATLPSIANQDGATAHELWGHEGVPAAVASR